MIKKYLLAASLLVGSLTHTLAQGWPAEYGGVMLQGFYWNSYTDTQWSYLESQADELADYFSLVWVPQSGHCGTANNMGYTPQYYWNQNSSFGSEAQLRSMISTFRQRGIGTIADVVINHRNNLGNGGSWVDYPSETYQGETYQMLPGDICANDDGGATKTWATQQGISLSANADTGEDWSGCRDLDHQSPNVQRVIKAYLSYLLADLGYAGFRYDMVKGYGAAYTGDYNHAAGPQFSVGEYWDGTYNIKRWVDGTRVDGVPQSAAFDFQFRYRVRDAINNADWTSLASNDMLIRNAGYDRYAVTFVENHDMEYRSASEQQDPIRSDTLQANAFLLAMPGTPCVFLRHWQDCKADIKRMIAARQMAGIHNTSTVRQLISNKYYYTLATEGTNGRLICVVGSKSAVSPSNPSWSQMQGEQQADYVEVITGKGYRYMLSRDCRTPWIDVPSGEYTQAFTTTVRAVAPQGATLVYTLDGTMPTPSSTPVADSGSITISESCTLSVGLVVGGSVVKTLTHRYVVKAFEPHTATIYLKDPGFAPVYFYAWDKVGQLLGAWPGKSITATTTIGGETWYYHTFDIPAPDYTFNIIFNRGSGKPQTVDIGNISDDKYFTVSDNGGSLNYADITEQMTPIEGIVAPSAPLSEAIYDLQGRRVARPVAGRLYIRGGKKYVAR